MFEEGTLKHVMHLTFNFFSFGGYPTYFTQLANDGFEKAKAKEIEKEIQPQVEAYKKQLHRSNL